MGIYRFPDGFVWGTATSSYQIEGAAYEDGRTPSIWDTFALRPGAILDRSNGDQADDHYHRYREDVGLMAELGVSAYRFSIAWPRILPAGVGKVNQPGLDFYKRLLDELGNKGITPYATLYHWDLPQILSDRGGWTQRFITDAFAEYADVVTRALGDRVKHWMTINEPWVVSYLGYGNGIHAPGVSHWESFLRAAHHVMLAHGKAVQVVRANCDAQTKVGMVYSLTWADPAADTAEDRAAARKHEGFSNRWFLDPVLKGRYPADMLNEFGWEYIPAEPCDLEIMSSPSDFFGVNYYTRSILTHDPAEQSGYRQVRNEGAQFTDMDWEVYPDGLYYLLKQLAQDYGLPMYITENGAAYPDEVSADGAVHDALRVAYYQSHLAACHRAMTEGVPLRGYFAWSLLDNFEWGWGYERRFGLVHVDYATQKRTLKDSGIWYAQCVDSNGFTLNE